MNCFLERLPGYPSYPIFDMFSKKNILRKQKIFFLSVNFLGNRVTEP
nr:MAG TPA: hypothetical protein [Caudoviricetes sp.]